MELPVWRSPLKEDYRGQAAGTINEHIRQLSVPTGHKSLVEFIADRVNGRDRKHPPMDSLPLP